MNHGGANNKIQWQGFQYVVQTIGPATRYHQGTLDMLRKIDPKAKRVALAYEDSEFAKMVMEGAEAQVKRLGLEVIFKRTYPKGVTDLTSMLSALKETNPDFILGGGHFEDGLLFNRQMANLNVDANALSLIASATLPDFYEALTSMAEGVTGPSHWEYGVKYSPDEAKKAGLLWIGPSQDEFVALFKKAVGEDVIPDYHAAEAGAAVLALVMGIEKAGSVDSDKVRKALGDLKFMSFYGGWDIDDTGLQIGHSMVDIQWQDGARSPDRQTLLSHAHLYRKGRGEAGSVKIARFVQEIHAYHQKLHLDEVKHSIRQHEPRPSQGNGDMSHFFLASCSALY